MRVESMEMQGNLNLVNPNQQQIMHQGGAGNLEIVSSNGDVVVEDIIFNENSITKTSITMSTDNTDNDNSGALVLSSGNSGTRELWVIHVVSWHSR